MSDSPATLGHMTSRTAAVLAAVLLAAFAISGCGKTAVGTPSHRSPAPVHSHPVKVHKHRAHHHA